MEVPVVMLFLPPVEGTPEKRKHRDDDDDGHCHHYHHHDHHHHHHLWVWPCVLPSPEPLHWPCEGQGTHALLPHNIVNTSLTVGTVHHYLLQDVAYDLCFANDY